MLSDFIYWNASYKNKIPTLILIMSAFAGGYTVSDYPKEFLNLFTTPIGQFLVFYSILYIVYIENPDVKFYDLILESLIAVFIIQFVKLILFKIYKN